MTVNKVATIFGAVFVVVGLLGFIPNPLVGTDALFHADAVHNVVHILSGAVLLWASKQGAGEAARWLRILGWVYVVVLVLGLLLVGLSGEGSLLGIMEINGADNILHLLLAAVFLYAGYKLPGATAAPSQM